jgi:transposase
MGIIEKQDFRTVCPEVRVAIRKRGMSMIKKGRRKGEVAKLLGVNKNTVSNWCKAYKANGMEGLSDKKRGTKSEDRKLLTDGQEIEIQELITDKYPEQYGLAFALWTRKSVKELIAEKYGVVLAIRTMGKYLRRWGFTPQKPRKKAYEQNPVKVQKWHEEEYPRLKKRAKEENAEIHWGDETGCKNQKTNMISTITNQGKEQFMIYSVCFCQGRGRACRGGGFRLSPEGCSFFFRIWLFCFPM